jgi:hypothetical protein
MARAHGDARCTWRGARYAAARFCPLRRPWHRPRRRHHPGGQVVGRDDALRRRDRVPAEHPQGRDLHEPDWRRAEGSVWITASLALPGTSTLVGRCRRWHPGRRDGCPDHHRRPLGAPVACFWSTLDDLPVPAPGLLRQREHLPVRSPRRTSRSSPPEMVCGGRESAGRREAIAGTGSSTRCPADAQARCSKRPQPRAILPAAMHTISGRDG